MGPRENEPNQQGSSTFGDKGQSTSTGVAATDTEFAVGALDTRWHADGVELQTGPEVRRKETHETVLGGHCR